MFRTTCLVILLLLIIAIPTAAQDENIIAACDTESMDLMIVTLDASITEARLAAELGQIDAYRYALSRIRASTAFIDALCSGLYFTSDENGQQPVIGPIVIPDGIYRVTVQTDAFIIVKVEPLEGTCEKKSFGSLFNISEGEASTGAQTLLTAEGCNALILIENTREPWTLGFELLSQ